MKRGEDGIWRTVGGVPVSERQQRELSGPEIDKQTTVDAKALTALAKRADEIAANPPSNNTRHHDWQMGYQDGAMAVAAEIDEARTALSEQPAPDHAGLDDPSSDERWNAGLDYAMEQLCALLGVNTNAVTWDAATETLDGDVRAVLGNIMRAKYGEDWGPREAIAALSRAPEAVAICKTCGQSFALNAEHNCPGLQLATPPAPQQGAAAAADGFVLISQMQSALAGLVHLIDIIHIENADKGHILPDGPTVTEARRLADLVLPASPAAAQGGAECATEGCGRPATFRFERGGVGSEYCHTCYMKVQSIPGAAS